MSAILVALAIGLLALTADNSAQAYDGHPKIFIDGATSAVSTC